MFSVSEAVGLGRFVGRHRLRVFATRGWPTTGTTGSWGRTGCSKRDFICGAGVRIVLTMASTRFAGEFDTNVAALPQSDGTAERLIAANKGVSVEVTLSAAF